MDRWRKLIASDHQHRKTRSLRLKSPGDLAELYKLAIADIRVGALASARERLRLVVRGDPTSILAWRNLAGVCQDLDLWLEAVDALRRVLELDSKAAEVHFALAWALTAVGRIEAAHREYRTLAGDPAWRWRALARIAQLRPASITDEESIAMALAARDGAEPFVTRIGLWFALGLAFEAQGAVDEAFDAFACGNALQRARLATAPPADRPAALLAAHQSSARFVRQTISPRFLAANAGAGDALAAPIFIVGMPRSGSTLIEQILASHRDVTALGETGILPALLERQYPASAADGFGAPLATLAGAYLAAARARGGRRGRLADKTLENYLHVGAIALMFPKAVILHAVRDPLDTCLACWRTLFNRGAETLYDLGEIGAEYVAYAGLMDHWREVLPGRVIDLSLEALTADPRGQIRALLKACDLSWDPACLRFWEADRPVRTASAAQVRSPITAAGIGRWRRYAHRLGPLREALAPVLPMD